MADYREPALDVRVYEDGPPPGGRLLGTANYGLKRADVAGFYGGFRAIEDVGYHLDISPEALPGPGRRIYVCASGPLVKAACTAPAHQ